MVVLVLVMLFSVLLALLVLGFVVVSHTERRVPIPLPRTVADALDRVTQAVGEATGEPLSPPRLAQRTPRPAVGPLGQRVRRLRLAAVARVTSTGQEAARTSQPRPQREAPTDIDLRARLRPVDGAGARSHGDAHSSSPMARHGVDPRA